MSSDVVPLPTQPIAIAPLQGTLALELEAVDSPPPFEPAPATTCDHRLRSWCQRFTQAAVEIVGGDRPLSQLARWTSEEVYAELERRARVVGRAGGFRPGQGQVQPVRPHVVGVHCSMITPQVSETAVRVRYGGRSRAVAARFELRRSRRDLEPRWICTALEFA